MGAVRVPTDDDGGLAGETTPPPSLASPIAGRTISGAFDFRIMLTIGLVFVIWNLVVAQSRFWVRALAVPVSIALVVTGMFVATMPFSVIGGLRLSTLVTEEADWLRVRRVARTMSVIAGLALLAIVALAR